MNNRNLRKRKVAQVIFRAATEKTIIVTLFVSKHFLLTSHRSLFDNEILSIVTLQLFTVVVEKSKILSRRN